MTDASHWMNWCLMTTPFDSEAGGGVGNPEITLSAEALLRPIMTMFARPLVCFAYISAMAAPMPELPPMKTAVGI